MEDIDDTEDMAAVGRSLMDSIWSLMKGDARFKHWMPAVGDKETALKTTIDEIVRLVENGELAPWDASKQLLALFRQHSRKSIAKLEEPSIDHKAHI